MTRHYPRGRLHPGDDGELSIKLSVDPETEAIVLDFGKPVTWIGMTADGAFAFAQLLADKAQALKGRRPE